MRTTYRDRFRRNDITEYLEWATPLGSITFEPLDNDYQNADPSNRTFTATIENPFNDIIKITATDSELIKILNAKIRKHISDEEEKQRLRELQPRPEKKYKSLVEYRQAVAEGRE